MMKFAVMMVLLAWGVYLSFYAMTATLNLLFRKQKETN